MTHRLVQTLAGALLLVAFGAHASTTPAVAAKPAAAKTAATTRCHDATGKFTKCAPAKPAAAVRCRDAAGKFIACAK